VAVVEAAYDDLFTYSISSFLCDIKEV